MSQRAGRRPRVSVVVPTRDTRDLALACLASLDALETPDGPPQVVVVDDGSVDGTAEAVRERYPDVQLLRNREPGGFTVAANRGLSAAVGELLLLLNSDTEVEPGAGRALDDAFRRHPRLGIAGARLRYPGGSSQWSGGREPSTLWLFALASGLPPVLGRVPGVRALRPVRGWSHRPVHWVTGAAMAIRRTAWEEIGPFDTAFELYCQDLDLCSRARRAGWQVSVEPTFRVLHHQGATVARSATTSGRQDPEMLWPELVRWAAKRGGSSRARRAALALRLGGRLRLAARRLAAPWCGAARRTAWRRDSLAYGRALTAVRREARACEPSSGGPRDQGRRGGDDSEQAANTPPGD